MSPITASAAAQELFRAHESKQWLEAARWMDADGLVEFRNQQRELIAVFGRFSARADASQRDPGHTVRSELEESLEKLAAGMGNPTLNAFAGVTTPAQFESLELRELFARWLEGHDPRPEQYDDGRGPIRRRTVVGEVGDGDSTTHVVYRLQTDVGSFGQSERMEVITARRVGVEWRFLPNRDIGSVMDGMTNMWTLDNNDRDELPQP